MASVESNSDNVNGPWVHQGIISLMMPLDFLMSQHGVIIENGGKLPITHRGMSHLHSSYHQPLILEMFCMLHSFLKNWFMS